MKKKRWTANQLIFAWWKISLVCRKYNRRRYCCHELPLIIHDLPILNLQNKHMFAQKMKSLQTNFKSNFRGEENTFSHCILFLYSFETIHLISPLYIRILSNSVFVDNQLLIYFQFFLDVWRMWKKGTAFTTQIITTSRAFSTNFGKLTQMYQSPGCLKFTQNGNFPSVKIWFSKQRFLLWFI